MWVHRTHAVPLDQLWRRTAPGPTLELSWGIWSGQGSSMEQEPHERTAPPAEPMSAWEAEISGRPTPRQSRRWRWLAAGLGVLALVAAAVVVTVLVTRPDKPAPRMTPELAVAFVQDEYPGKYRDAAKLIELFNATCHTLDEGNGSRYAATLPFLQAGLSVDEATYILDISIDSTCPKYAQR